jgi:pimeloyl-ACP methyl ester carboxylesterase
MTSEEKTVKAPSLGLLASEGLGLLDMAGLIAAAPFLATAPRGKSHPVIVLPGLGADDRSTVAIRGFLRWLGYKVYGWGRGRNVRAANVDLPEIVAQTLALRKELGEKVSLVGWSRGGILAREVARQIPDAVRLVVTLGSPFAAPGATNVKVIWKVLTGKNFEPPSPERVKQLAAPIPVPSTSIYTRTDGVAAWRACLEEPGDLRENIEVKTTHLGLGFHAPALWVIADRLAQPEGSWKPFRPGGALAIWFPRTDRGSS